MSAQPIPPAAPRGKKVAQSVPSRNYQVRQQPRSQYGRSSRGRGVGGTGRGRGRGQTVIGRSGQPSAYGQGQRGPSRGGGAKRTYGGRTYNGVGNGRQMPPLVEEGQAKSMTSLPPPVSSPYQQFGPQDDALGDLDDVIGGLENGLDNGFNPQQYGGVDARGSDVQPKQKKKKKKKDVPAGIPDGPNSGGFYDNGGGLDGDMTGLDMNPIDELDNVLRDNQSYSTYSRPAESDYMTTSAMNTGPAQPFQPLPVAPPRRSQVPAPQLQQQPLPPPIQPQHYHPPRPMQASGQDYNMENAQQVQPRRPEQRPYANGAEVDQWQKDPFEDADDIQSEQQLQQQQRVSRQWSAPISVGDETKRYLEQLSLLIDSWDSRQDIGVLTLTVNKVVSQLTSQRTISEFLSSQLNGLPVLVRLLYNIQTDFVVESDGVTPNDKAQYSTLDDEQYLSQLQSVERNILQCLERFTHFENSRSALLTDTVAVRTIVPSTTNHGGNDVNALALKILTSLCDSHRNTDVILQAFADHAIDINERLQPFGQLVENLNTAKDAVYMVNCMKLLNALYKHSAGTEFREEMIDAGLNVLRLKQFAARCTDRYAAVQLSDEIETWEWLNDDVRDDRKPQFTWQIGDDGVTNGRGGNEPVEDNVYDELDRVEVEVDYARETKGTPAAVGQLRQNSVPNDRRQSDIDRLRNENNALRQQLTFAEANIEEWREAANKSEVFAKELAEKKQQLEQQCDDYYRTAQQNKALADKLRALYRDRMGRNPEDDVQFKDFVVNNDATLEPLDANVIKADADASRAQRNAQQTNTGGAPAPPIAASVPLAYVANTVRVKLTNHRNLPLLHWTPLSATETTMFQDIDSESIIRQLDFNDFETLFELRSARPQVKPETPLAIVDTPDSRPAGVVAMLPQQMSISAERVEFVESQRARNMIITQKKTKMSAEDLKLAIESSDIKRLPGEYAELLLKYVPTNEERKNLQEIDPSQYINMGDAEIFLYHMDQIERMESKLNVMVFMGQFDELVATIMPSIEQLRAASESVCQSLKLRRLFEIVLAFGNYMNGAKRGFAYGFKLDSLAKLSDVKSRVDRNVTLLHYIADVVIEKYPNIADFYDELKIDINRAVSYQGITASMLTLRGGIDIVEYELSLQPDNAEISTFYESANPIVVQIQRQFHEMQDSYRAVCLMFAENFRLIEPLALFGPITAFIASFKKAVNDNYQRTHPTVKPQVVNFKPVPTPRRPPPTPVVVQTPTDAAVLTPKVELRQKPLAALRHVEPPPGRVSYVINGTNASMAATASKLDEPSALGNNQRRDDVISTDVSANAMSQQQQQLKLTNPDYVSHSTLSDRSAVKSAANSRSSNGDVNDANHVPLHEVSSEEDPTTSVGDDVPGQYDNVASEASVYDSVDDNYAENNSSQYDDVTRDSAVYEAVTDNEYTYNGTVTDEEGYESTDIDQLLKLDEAPAEDTEDSYL